MKAGMLHESTRQYVSDRVRGASLHAQGQACDPDDGVGGLVWPAVWDACF